jgi:hypothetical protein
LELALEKDNVETIPSLPLRPPVDLLRASAFSKHAAPEITQAAAIVRALADKVPDQDADSDEEHLPKADDDPQYSYQQAEENADRLAAMFLHLIRNVFVERPAIPHLDFPLSVFKAASLKVSESEHQGRPAGCYSGFDWCS